MKSTGWSIGDWVRFAHMPPRAQSFRVRAISKDGMLTLEGTSGEFAPHIFIEGDKPGEFVTRSEIDEFSRKVKGQGR